MTPIYSNGNSIIQTTNGLAGSSGCCCPQCLCPGCRSLITNQCLTGVVENDCFANTGVWVCDCCTPSVSPSPTPRCFACYDNAGRNMGYNYNTQYRPCLDAGGSWISMPC